MNDCCTSMMMIVAILLWILLWILWIGDWFRRCQFNEFGSACAVWSEQCSWCRNILLFWWIVLWSSSLCKEGIRDVWRVRKWKWKWNCWILTNRYPVLIAIDDYNALYDYSAFEYRNRPYVFFNSIPNSIHSFIHSFLFISIHSSTYL